MNTKWLKKLLVMAALMLILLLTACQVNLITEIDKDGSGLYIQEVGFQGDEAMMSGFSVDDEGFCSAQMEELPPNTTIRQETRNEDEIWCVYESAFGSLEELRDIYGMTETQINSLDMNAGTLSYDIALDLSGDSSAPMGADIFWQLTLPGEIISHNANEVDQNTLTWKLRGGEINHIQASSEVGGLGLDLGDGNPLLYVLGGGMFLVFCCFVPLLFGGVIFFLLRNKKAKETQ